MNDHPILFNAEMIRAILAGRKTQTRRVIRFPSWISDPKDGQPTCLPIQCDGYCDTRAITKEDCWTFGRRLCGRGHALWVRETFCLENTSDYHGDQIVPPGTPVQKHDDEPNGEFDAGPYWLIPHYRATEPDAAIYEHDEDHTRWSPSIHMPRWASRITLLVKNVRVERLQDITDKGARAEGIVDGGCGNCGNPEPCNCDNPSPLPVESFIRLWNSINENGWNENPWVWVVKFELKGGVR